MRSLAFLLCTSLAAPAMAAGEKPVTPVGAVCLSITTKIEGGIIYERRCTYPDGTIWECTAALNICKRTKLEVFRSNRPAAQSGGTTVAPETQSSSPTAKKPSAGSLIIAPNN